MYKLLLIAMGGAAGTLARYGVGAWMRETSDRLAFPLGILVVNLLGCFLIGYLQGWFGRMTGLSVEHRLALTVGFLGAFTTFSTFGWDTAVLLREGRLGPALLNVGISAVGGIVMVIAGAKLAGADAVP